MTDNAMQITPEMMAQLQAILASQITAAVAPAPTPKTSKAKATVKPELAWTTTPAADFEAEVEPESDDADGTMTIDKTGLVTLQFRPKAWKQGKRSKALRGSGERGEVVCRGLFGNRACGCYIRGFLGNAK